MALVGILNDNLPNIQYENAEFIEIHLDERYYSKENMTLYRVQQTQAGVGMLLDSCMHFWDPDQCIDFITSYEWRKIFITLSDKFSYLLPLIDDLPQIVSIYIYSTSPEKVSYFSTDYKKLRAIINENSPDANNQLLSDIEIFRRDLMPINVINPRRRKTKLLIQEPLSVDEYMIIWIDNNDAITNFDTKRLTDVINRLDIFYNTQQCIDAIKSSSENTKIFLISSHSDTDIIIKEVGHLLNVIAIYCFDHDEQKAVNLNDSVPKVHGRYSDLEILSNQLFHDYKNLTHNSPLSISIFCREQNQKTVRDLNKESARFLWLQILIDILIKTPCNDQSKDEMLDECRTNYKDNANELKSIEEFDKNYKSTEALKFYTNNSFIYRLFNRAFRTENIDSIFIFRFFLTDMYNQLQKLYSEQFLTNSKHGDVNLVVYRGQWMKTTEFDQIKNNIGRLISVGTFFSTTKNCEVAVMYSGNQEPDSLSVIFEIEVNLNRDATKRPFASIEHLSQFSDEEEVLFSVGSTFRIVDVHDRRTSDGYWIVKMIMVEDDTDLNELRNELEKEYSQQGSLCDLGSALIGMGDYDRAERYYTMLLEYLPENHPSTGHIQLALGIIFENRGDYQTALKFQEQALKFYTRYGFLDQNKNEVGKTYVHISQSYRHLGQLDLALKYCSMAADIQSPTGSLAFTYNEIAITHRDKGDNRLALEYFLKSLNIEEQVLKRTKYHPKLATAYNNIGEIYSQLGDYENALKYLEYALDIRLKGGVPTHTDLAAIYHNLGNIYVKKNELKKALEMHEKALEIDTQALPNDHESLANSHYAIAYVYVHFNDLTNALDHSEKGLRILLRSQAKDNHSLIGKHQHLLGNIQCHVGNNRNALKMAEKSLNNFLACSSENQKDIAAVYDLFSLIYEKEGDISKALEYSEKAVEMAKIWAMRNHTFEWQHFLLRLNELKNKSSNENIRVPTSFTEGKICLDNIDVQDHIIPQLTEELQQISENNIQRRLELLSTLISMYSRKKNYSMAMKCFDEANNIYTEHQSSDEINKEQMKNRMIIIFYNTARVYHRQEDWNMCLNMLTRSINIVQQQNEEHLILPEIYYCMASCYAHQQNIHMAIHYYKLTISTAKKRLSDDHPDMQRYCFQLQYLYNLLKISSN